jgi:hypothetical protein
MHVQDGHQVSERESNLIAQIRSIQRHHALIEASGERTQKAVEKEQRAELELLRVILSGLGNSFRPACGPIVEAALYKVGAAQDIRVFHSEEWKGVCLTGDNHWPRERWDRLAPVGKHAEVDVWAAVRGGMAPLLLRSSYSTAWEGAGNFIVRWTQTLEEITPHEALLAGVTAEGVADRLSEALASQYQRAERTESQAMDRTNRLRCIVGLLTGRGVSKLLALVLLATTAHSGCSSGDTSSEPDAAVGDAAPSDAPKAVECSKHSDCPSDACLPDGTCALEIDVAYLSTQADSVSAECTRAAPCFHLDVASQSGKPVWRVYQVELRPGWGSATFHDRHVTIVGEPGKSFIEGPISSTTNLIDSANSRLEIDGVDFIGYGTREAIHFANASRDKDLTVRNASFSGFDAALNVPSVGKLALDGVRFARNREAALVAFGNIVRIASSSFVSNGIPILATGSTRVDMINTVVAYNHAELGSAIPTAAVSLRSQRGGSLVNNTIVGNVALIGDEAPVAGVFVDPVFHAAGNIVAMNVGHDGRPTAQTGGAKHLGGLISAYPGEPMTIESEYLIDSEWAGVFVEPFIDFHLRRGSRAIDKSFVDPRVTHDRDGEPRVGRPDVGAYEAPQ